MEQIETAIEKLTEKVTDFQQKQEEKFAAFSQKYKQAQPHHQRPATALETVEKPFNTFLKKGDLRFAQKSLSTTDDASAGYLVPEYLHDKILNEINTLSPIRSQARTLSISTSAADILLNKKDPDVGWTSETDERAETKAPELFKLHIPTHEIYARPRATQKLLDDAKINVEDWLVHRIASQMARLETQAFIHGDGQNKPTGILSYEMTTDTNPSWRKIQKITTGADGDFKADQAAETLIETAHALKPHYLDNAVWMMSRSALAAVRKLKDPHTGHFLWQPSLGQTSATLLSHPVIVCDEMPALVKGTQSQSIVFANFKKAYQIVDRGNMNILRDPYSSKPYVEFYVTKRVGGDLVDTEALKVISFEK